MRSWSILFAVVSAAGCRQVLGIGDTSVAPDAATGCAAWTPAPRHFDPCAIDPTAPGITIGAGSYVLDTDTGILTDLLTGSMTLLPGRAQGPTFLVSTEQLAINGGATIRLTGTRGLVVDRLKRARSPCARSSSRLDRRCEQLVDDLAPVACRAGLGDDGRLHAELAGQARGGPHPAQTARQVVESIGHRAVMPDGLGR
jgi:hypothetical protein